MQIISLRNISFKYPQIKSEFILEEFSCNISKGEIIRVIGRNGKGKSTLLKIIANELTILKGQRITYEDPKIIYLNQNANNFLADDLTIREQLLVNPDIRNANKNWFNLEHVLSEYELELETRMDEFIGHLSGGQKQIIALLASILNGCDLLCLDEFSSGMDVHSKEISLKILNELNQKHNLSLIEVSHSNELNFNINKKISL